MNLEQLRAYKPDILAIAAEHGVGNVRVFGSVARGEASENSDVDFLVSIEKLLGWKYFSLGPTLEELLHTKVDVVSDEAIRPRLRERILKDAIPL